MKFVRKMKNEIEVVFGDITELDCDAIVNAANSSLLGGGGVDGAIHQKAGPLLVEECKKIGGCPAGESRITSGFNLKAKHVIHAVGPIWQNGQNKEKEILKSAYVHSLQTASKNGIKTVAFPNISTGVYRYPKRQAARIAIEAVKSEMSKNGIKKVIFACFDNENYSIYKEYLEA